MSSSRAVTRKTVCVTTAADREPADGSRHGTQQLSAPGARGRLHAWGLACMGPNNQQLIFSGPGSVHHHLLPLSRLSSETQHLPAHAVCTAQGVSSMPPSMFPPPQEGMIQVNPEKLQGQQAAAGPSNAYPPPPNAYPPPSSGYPPTSSAYPPAPGAYPPQPDPYQPAQGVPVQGYPVGYAPGPIGGTPAGYPGAAPPAGPPGAMYMTGPPPADDGKAGPIVCVAIVLFIIGEGTVWINGGAVQASVWWAVCSC